MKYLLCTSAATMVIAVLIATYVHLPKFGSIPRGIRLERIQKSTNYKNRKFQNIYQLHTDASICKLDTYKKLLGIIGKFIAGKNDISIPSVKTDLMNLNKNEDILVWFGHASYFIQIEGKRIVVDPVLSDVSSPIPFFPVAFRGTHVYATTEIPELDYLIITHDHWDHLDYETVTKLKAKQIICPLGVGAHFERWRFAQSKLLEMDWHDEIELEDGFRIICCPTQHFSGRGFTRNKSLWGAFLLTSSSEFKIYVGGDGGYCPHFKEVGKKHGPINIAILENGQYNENWKYAHMHPTETIMAAEDLRAKVLLPVHNSKFSLAPHAWNEPLNEITRLGKNKDVRLLTPMIGQKVNIKDTDQPFNAWW
ncbi:MAG: MBL fold metallo-hydrolase [Puniceicoccales bacterium]|jgi:L-ascorbate metabolism protein UlaG (beta-lactamase superfamily)|nr:MBL fold metallo-hydrolase [Puniceicoccales bacterium]